MSETFGPYYVHVTQYKHRECFSYLTDKRQADGLAGFITFPKGYFHSDRLSSPCHRLLTLLEKQRRTRRWQSVGRCVEPVLIGQKRNKHPI